MDCSLPGSSVHGILQARIRKWVAISFSGDIPNPGIKFVSLMPPVLSGRFLTTRATWEAQVDLGLEKMIDLGLESKLKEIKGQ